MTWEQIEPYEPECAICHGKLDSGDCPLHCKTCEYADEMVDVEKDGARLPALTYERSE